MTGIGSNLENAPPVLFRGEIHRAEKRYWHGTQRIISPEETLERIQPFFRHIGLRRLANITGLDRIGIPVVLSVRPNSGYLSVDAGKGFTVAAATASAAMECFERFTPEFVRLDEFTASHRQVEAKHRVIPLNALPLSRNSLFHPGRPERWTLGWDLIGQSQVAVPTQMVTLDRYRCAKSELLSFQIGSNGLSSGNNFLEALTGGLYEVVERDAVACWRRAWEHGDHPPPRVDLARVGNPQVRELAERLEKAEVGLVLFDCTTDTAVPVFMAYIYDRNSQKLGVYRGYGAHLDPSIAMIRAITEAVQGRLIFIAGSRDDAFRHHRRLRRDTDSLMIRALEEIPPTVVPDQKPSENTPTFEGDVDRILKKLLRVGIDQVLVFDLSFQEFGISVLRVIIPGLEGYMFETYTPGSRAGAFLAQRSA